MSGKPEGTRMAMQLQDMEDEGFVVKIRKTDDNVIQMVLIIHSRCIDLIKHFVVLALDATYQTNHLNMPLLNIVGFTNVGGSRLSSFLAASVLMISEVNANYQWTLDSFKEIIRDNASSTIKFILSDQDLALVKAIETVFPECHHMFCIWHIHQNLKKNYEEAFKATTGTNDVEKEKHCHNIINKLIYSADEEKFWILVEKLRALFTSSLK